MKPISLSALPCSFALLLAGNANAWQQGSLEVFTNGYIVRSLACNGTKLEQIETIKALPAHMDSSLDGVSDRGGPFNVGDVGGGPRQRFIVGALSKDVALISIEQGGIAYNVQLWAFVKNGNSWEPAPSGYFGFDPEKPRQNFIPQALKAFGCGPTDHPTATDTELADVLKVKAQTGDTAAQYTLGHLYAIGRGINKSLAAAVTWYRKAAESDAYAQYDLGQLYLKGTEFPADPAQAMHYFRLALQTRDDVLKRAATIQLGYIYADGIGVPANSVAAYALLELAQSYGDRQVEAKTEALKAKLNPAQSILAEQLIGDMFAASSDNHSLTEPLDYFLATGRLKSSERLVPSPPPPRQSGETYYRHQDYPNARQEFQLRATQGDGKAAAMMGAMALWGRGTPQNPGEAADWFKKGADHGDPVAMADLASMYQDGRGMPPDLKEALAWYGKAAAKGDKRAALVLPVIQAAVLQRVQTHLPMTAPVSDIELIGLEKDNCDGKVKQVLQNAESRLPSNAAPLNSAVALPGQLSLMASFVPSPYELYAELAAEYAWAGCFADAARVMDTHKSFGRIARDNALYEVAEALAHHGATGPAVALTYTAENERTQERILWRILTRNALDGRADSAVDLGETLVQQDGMPVTAASGILVQNLLKKGDYRDLIKIESMPRMQAELGVDGNLILADAYFHSNNTRSALRSLKAAESNLPENHPASTTPSAYSPGHLAQIQAMLEPASVDTTLERNQHSLAVFRIEALNFAIAATQDKTWRKHWAEEIDRLMPNAQEQLKAGGPNMTAVICTAADSQAMVGNYQEALDLRQQWHCEPVTHSPNAVADNLAAVLRVGAMNNDIARAAQIIPAEMRNPKDRYRPYLMPLLFGYVRAGDQGQALDTLRQMTRMASRPQEGFVDTIAEVGQIADGNFPVDAWIAEIRANRMKLGVSKWDTLRILFAVCARTRGFDEAYRLESGLDGDDLIAADIGIAEGMRHFQIAPDNPRFSQ